MSSGQVQAMGSTKTRSRPPATCAHPPIHVFRIGPADPIPGLHVVEAPDIPQLLSRRAYGVPACMFSTFYSVCYTGTTGNSTIPHSYSCGACAAPFGDSAKYPPPNSRTCTWPISTERQVSVCLSPCPPVTTSPGLQL